MLTATRLPREARVLARKESEKARHSRRIARKMNARKGEER